MQLTNGHNLATMTRKKTPTLYSTTHLRSFLVTCWTKPTELILAETWGTIVKIQNILYAHPALFESFFRYAARRNRVRQG